ncbi:hypothetical protein BJ508DRAFT_381289 [Ascobolus immersus RN42]|uniref:F-box domain-containing protein n=1 Tax=Ascobolus immersus RN42 TaxID=1160509 RepID=A0A3N4HHE2_ASCIM|nr:hypothetical protein BJ508DRAFT_381289 [Ascobolus immersus RN42]
MNEDLQQLEPITMSQQTQVEPNMVPLGSLALISPELRGLIFSYLSNQELISSTRASKEWATQVGAYCRSVRPRQILPISYNCLSQMNSFVDLFKFFCTKTDPQSSRVPGPDITLAVHFLISGTRDKNSMVQLCKVDCCCPDHFTLYHRRYDQAYQDHYETNVVHELRTIIETQFQHDPSCTDCSYSSEPTLQDYVPDHSIVTCLRFQEAGSIHNHCLYSVAVIQFGMDLETGRIMMGFQRIRLVTLWGLVKLSRFCTL